MEASIRQIVSDFEAGPMQGSRALHSLFARDRAAFFDAALPLIRSDEESQGVQYLLTLLASHGVLLKALCLPSLFTLDEALRIARRLLRVDPRLDVNLLRGVFQKNGSTPAHELHQMAATDIGLRLLDILGDVSDGTRVLPTMTRLLNHPDPRVRSKAALLVGRSNKNPKFAQEQLAEPDSRIRANAIESLWGADSAGARAVYLSALGDENSRVVGNAILGLYRLGDGGSVGLVQQLLSHPDASFRATALWVMGETGDPRFTPALTRLISDPDLRGNAFRALARLKKSTAARGSNPPIAVFAGPLRRLDSGWNQLTVSIHCPTGHKLPELNPTHFSVWEGATLVSDFAVRQRGKHEPFAVALGFPRILDRISHAMGIQENAIERALRHKRKDDLWMVLKYATNLGQGQSADVAMSVADEDLSSVRMRFTTNADAVADAVSTPGTRLSSASDLQQAVRSLTEAISQTRAIRNVILICESERDTFPAGPRAEIQAAYMSSVAVHIITPWPTAAMSEFCSATGGTLLTPSSPDGIPKALEGLCGSLLNSYELSYRPETAAATNVRFQIATGSLIGECCLAPAPPATQPPVTQPMLEGELAHR